MALNAALSINKCTDSILQIIEAECTKATEWWRREFECQQQYVKALYTELLIVQTERDNALAEARQAARHMAETEQSAGEVREQTAVDNRAADSEVQQLRAEVQSWKNKYEMAARLRDDAERQLERTRTRFSLTVVPMSPLGMFSMFILVTRVLCPEA